MRVSQLAARVKADGLGMYYIYKVLTEMEVKTVYVCVFKHTGELIHGERTVRTRLEQRCRMEPVCLLGC